MYVVHVSITSLKLVQQVKYTWNTGYTALNMNILSAVQKNGELPLLYL